MESLYLSINPINKCTMECGYCGTGTYNKALAMGRLQIDYPRLENAISFLLEHLPQLSKKVGRFNSKDVFLCYEDIVKPTILAHPDFFWSIHSNGLLLKETQMDFFKENRVGLLISLDGPKEVQDINRLSKNGKSIFDIVWEKSQIAKEKGLNPLIVSTFNRKSILKIYQTYLFHINNKNRFSFLFDVTFSNYSDIISEISQVFKEIAQDFAQRSKEEQFLWQDFANIFERNTETWYSAAINSNKIRVKSHLNTYRDFAEYDFQNKQYKIVADEISSQDKKGGTSCNPCHEWCKKCWAYPGFLTKFTKKNFSIYCLLNTLIFNELERQGFNKDDFSN